MTPAVYALATHHDDARTHLSDLLVATAARDHLAFNRLYLLTRVKLLGVCLRVCVDPAVAEDVLAEVYIIVWKRADSWQPGRCSPITWLSAIARNRAIDWRRRHRPMTVLSTEMVDRTAGPEADCLSVMIHAERDRGIRDHIDALEPHIRDVIMTAFFGGLSYPELAQAKGVPLGTIKSWVRRGLAQVRAQMI